MRSSAPGDVVGLDAERERGLLADELAVGVEVVARDARQNGCSQTSSAWRKRWTCSDTPSASMPRSAATSW